MTLVLTLLIFSCTKEILKVEESRIPVDVESIIASDCEDERLCTNILCVLADNEDYNNHKINMILYHYAQAIKSTIQDTRFTDLLISRVLEDEKTLGVSIHDLTIENPIFQSALNTALRSSIANSSVYPNGETGFDLSSNISEYLKTNFTYGTDVYEPIIYLVKRPETIDQSQINIFIGEEGNSCDEVLGWRRDAPSFISENEVLNSEELNIFVGVGEVLQEEHLFATSIESIESDKLLSDFSENSRLMNVNIDYFKYQIKKGYRYERTGDSEVHGFRMSYFPETESPRSLITWFDKKISKNDINNSKIFSEQGFAFSMNQLDFARDREVFIGAWENDWYASGKLIMNNCSNFVRHSVSTKRKFSHEWYFYGCDDLNNYFPYVNIYEVFSNNKCQFDLIRTQ